MVGGYAAAAGCAIIGPRIGRFNADGTVSMPLNKISNLHPAIFSDQHLLHLPSFQELLGRMQIPSCSRWTCTFFPRCVLPV